MLPPSGRSPRRAFATTRPEPVDFDWAITQEAGLTAEVDVLARESQTFELGRTECRSSSCLVRVAWEPDSGDAADDLLVSSPLGLGCRFQMLPPDPEATEATVYFDCARMREHERTAVPMVSTVSSAVPSHGHGWFYLDSNGNNQWDSGDTAVQYGDGTDIPVTGDFNGDGIDEIGVFRNGSWYIDMNNNSQWSGAGDGDAEWSFGQAGDMPVVSPTKWNCSW